MTSSIEPLVSGGRVNQVQSRYLSTNFPVLGVDLKGAGPGAHPLSEEDFHRGADLTLGQLFDKMTTFAEEHTEPKATVDMTEDKLFIRSGDSGGIQVVKDSKSKLLQVNSPANKGMSTSADVAFQMVSDPGECRWEAVKGGGDLHELLSQNLESMASVSFDLSPDAQYGGPDVT